MGEWKDKLAELKKSLLGAKAAPEQPDSKGARPVAQSGQTSHKQPARRYVCIGLDFGTSSTKAVVQLLPVGPAFAVPLAGAGASAGPYLAPTRLWVKDDGAAALAADGSGGWVEDLKVNLMERPWQSSPAVPGAQVLSRPADHAAAFLTLTLRSLLSWIDEEVRPSLGVAQISWSMNLGIPARDFDAEMIREAFAAVARAAWQMGVEGGGVTIERAARTVNAAKEPSFVPHGMERGMIEVVPEVAAGMTTYARSPRRQAGAHLFVDVGATTLDSSVFLLHEAGNGLKYVFLSADVDSRLGALRLHRHRASELGRLALDRFAASDPLIPIPATAKDCVPPDEDILSIDSRFGEDCVRRLGSVIYNAKLKAPVEMSVPDGGSDGYIQVLLSGGGINLPLYQRAIQEAGRRAGPNGGLGLRIKRFRREQIPQPAELRAPGLSAGSWQRLAVAYGLSYQFEDIGEFIPPSSVPKAPPRRRRDADNDAYISKDQV
jgi:hypothetical protein